MTRAVRMAVWMALGTACGSGCKWHKGPPPFYVSRIAASEETLDDNPALGMDAVALTNRLVVALDGTGRFAPLPGAVDGGLAGTPPRPHSYRCRVRVNFTRESDEPAEEAPLEAAPAARPAAPTRTAEAEGHGTPPAEAAALRRAEVGVGIELTPAGEDAEPVHAEAVGSRLFDASGKAGTPRNHAFRGALDAALADAAAQLILQLDAMGETDAQLIADLSSADGGVRSCAVGQLAERRNPAAVPALIAQLKSPDHPTVMKALGLLEALHDQRAVKPLIELTEKQDPEFVRQVVYVLGAIGGTEAEAFLYTLENGSQEAQVRVAAAEAAAELRQRRAAPHPPAAAGGRNDAGVQAARR